MEFDLRSASDVIKKEAHDLLLVKDFDTIEKLAIEARDNKERIIGGYWKIDSIYEGLTNIYSEYPKQQVNDEMWKNRIKLLKKWKKKSPKSITARVALAMSYIHYGWFIRGGGYINTVSRENFRLFQQKLSMASNELFEAKSLDEKCPRWYREVLILGVFKGISQIKFEEAFEEAINYEPSYLQYYLVKSEYLTPKWRGKEGDWQKFVDALPSKLATLDTDESNIIYFVVLANKLRDPSLTINWKMVSENRISKGFDDLEKKYKVDNTRLNQYAMITSFTFNLSAAKATFVRIGDDWDKDVWGSKKTFNTMRAFANRSRE